MNPSINILSKVAIKNTKMILGLMSGTSLDGLDIACCTITDTGYDTRLIVSAFKTVDYPQGIKQRLNSLVSVETVPTQELTILNTILGDYYGKQVLETLAEWNIEPADVDCIASHGQTIYHAPKNQHQQKDEPNATLQMSDGDHIARKTGILTISDFRQKHTAAGGEGAPLVAPVDDLLFRDEKENRILLNIGGIANFTWLPAGSEKSPRITTDTGPGNTLINGAMQEYFNQPYDDGGAVAKRGTVHVELLQKLLDHPFFNEDAPKTTGPELFNMAWVKEKQQAVVPDISVEDLVATLTWLTARTIVDAIKNISDKPHFELYLSGGGMHNRQLVVWIEELLEQKIHSFEKIGFNPDAKEAACFAVLANEMLSGEGFEVNGQKVNFGKISLPI